jgi:serine/threonine protein kinase/tetratricopeptide (TPR) repeat protein
MAVSRKCTSCGAEVPPGTPGEYCVRCAFQFALGAESEQYPPTQPLPDTIQVSAAPAEKLDDMIGHYKLLEKIGEGGFGVVYVAEQKEPVRRRVALKIIKLGMDTRRVVARFEAERQALAMMDHPNIAKVLDAGATEAGRPYFVMELVRGIKITDYCNQSHASPRQRLELFIQVCRAVQHAHQKGVIHRDIKPSNILVTLHDGVPVPKVIDFGIAKATQGYLTDSTVYTEFQQFIGTPAYVSPEQAEMSGLDVDTRADLYSLGVLLYELLTNQTPFSTKDLLAQGMDEMRRIIREDEPARPSTRLSRLAGEDLTTTARQRGVDAPKLIHVVRGDLDWIVMKCLEKDRTRRYETANGLAMDIQRHLGDEPVSACPPSRLYKFQKVVRRNKLAVGAVVAVSLALLLGAGASTWQAIRATRTERALTRSLEEATATGATDQALIQADKLLNEGKFAQAESLFQRALVLNRKAWPGQPKKWQASATLLIDVISSQGKFDEAERTWNEILTPDVVIQPQSAALLHDRAEFLANRGRWNAAAADLSKAIELDPSDHFFYYQLAPLLVQLGDLDGYRSDCGRMLARFGDTTDPIIAERTAKDCLIVSNAMVDLTAVGKLAERAVRNGKEHQYFCWFAGTESLAEFRQSRFESAASWAQKALNATDSKVYPKYLNLVAEVLPVLAMAQYNLKHADEARETLRRGNQILETKFPTVDSTGGLWNDWIIAHVLMKQAEELIQGPASEAKQ